MNRWHIKISGYAYTESAREDIVDAWHPSATTRARATDAVNEVEVSEFTTGFDWSTALSSPYEQARVQLAVPYAEMRRLVGLGSIDNNKFTPHASGWLTIYEDVDGTMKTRFYGPVSRVTSGVQTDTKTGTKNTLRLTVTATSWLSVLSRGFRVSAREDLNVAGSLISLSEWTEIMDSVIQAAYTSLPAAFERAWERLAALHTLPTGGTVSDFSAVSHGPIDVQGRNLSQIQIPSMRSTLWGVLTATFQAADFVELYPKWTYTEKDSYATVVYRLRPPSPSISAGGGENYLRDTYQMSASPQYLPLTYRSVSFLPELDAPTLLNDVHQFSVEYDGTSRANYIEVTSPYVGGASLAGISSDPLFLDEDIKRYGLQEYTPEYPYFRDESTPREQLNEMNSYAALLKAEAHRYGSGKVETKYTPDIASHGDWVQWYSYGADSTPLEGYVTSVTHTVKVGENGEVTANSSWTVERVATYQRRGR